MPTQTERIFIALHELHKFNALFMAHADAPLPPGEFLLLDRLYALTRCLNCSEVNVSDLKGKRNMSLPAVSQTLNALERKGLVTRHISAADRRRVSVSITSEGESAVERTRRVMENAMSRVIARFGAENAQELIELLEQFARVVAQMAKEKTNEVSKP